MRIERKLLLGLMTTLLLAACNNTSFKSAPNKRAADAVTPPPAEEKVFRLACQGNQGVARLVQDVKGNARTQVRLEGEFCGIETPVATGTMTVLFIVDYSGSMLNNDPE